MYPSRSDHRSRSRFAGHPENRNRQLGYIGSVLAAAGCVLWLVACAPASGGSTEGAVGEKPGTGPTSRFHGRPEDRFLDVLTFNTALLPEPVSYTLPGVRVAMMAPHLKGYDVLVLQEAFVHGWREALIAQLADSYPYRGEMVGSAGARGLALRQDGGILMLSRWPIVRSAAMTFDDVCSGTDCLADKGVAYVAIRKGELTYHVFGTHAQSSFGWNVSTVRAAQFELFAGFVEQQEIPTDEVVLLAGDFNVDAGTPERDAMLRTLRAVWPPVVGAMRATWDPAHNEWAEGPEAWLDYVLVADGYRRPAAAWNRAVPLREGSRDLSDHYAVWARVALPPDP